MSYSNSINVVVVQKRQIQVTTNATAGIIDSTNPVVLKNNPTIPPKGVDRLSNLLDVDATDRVLGDTVVYYPHEDSYVVEPLDLKYVTGRVNGGTF
jgi:hypothetical protein